MVKSNPSAEGVLVIWLTLGTKDPREEVLSPMR